MYKVLLLYICKIMDNNYFKLDFILGYIKIGIQGPAIRLLT
jgi:hypothetical protein